MRFGLKIAEGMLAGVRMVEGKPLFQAPPRSQPAGTISFVPVALPLVAHCGIGAGSPWATWELEDYSCIMFRRLIARHPRVHVCLHVDDLGVILQGASAQEVVIGSASAADGARQ